MKTQRVLENGCEFNLRDKTLTRVGKSGISASVHVWKSSNIP